MHIVFISFSLVELSCGVLMGKIVIHIYICKETKVQGECLKSSELLRKKEWSSEVFLDSYFYVRVLKALTA